MSKWELITSCSVIASSICCFLLTFPRRGSHVSLPNAELPITFPNSPSQIMIKENKSLLKLMVGDAEVVDAEDAVLTLLAAGVHVDLT